jgi:LysM repeat protein
MLSDQDFLKGWASGRPFYMLQLARMLVVTMVLAAAYAAIPIAPAAASSHCGDGVRVSPGDTLARIASYCGISIQSLMAANPQITNPSVIYVGQIINMPGRGGPPPVVPSPSRPSPFPPPVVGASCGPVVTVRPGDTLARIALRCSTTVGRILSVNPQIRDAGRLYVGMQIRMPTGAPSWPGPSPQPPRPTTERIVGTVPAEGATCPAMRGDDGRLYTLTGRTGSLRSGDRIEVTGVRATASICQQGVTIAVEQLRRIGWAPAPAPTPTPGIDVTGTITREGVTCLAMRGDDGRLYTLAGDTRGIRPGERVRVVGRRAEVSNCQQGITIDADRIVVTR